MNELSQKNNPSSSSYSNYFNTNISPIYSTQNGWITIPEKYYCLNQKILPCKCFNVKCTFLRRKCSILFYL